MRYNMYLGICNVEQAQSHKFESWGWLNVGDQHYCVQSNGPVKNHSDASENSSAKSFNMKTGDLLKFEYHFENCKLKVTNGNDQLVEIEVTKGKKNENYVVCAYLFCSGDSIEMISP